MELGQGDDPVDRTNVGRQHDAEESRSADAAPSSTASADAGPSSADGAQRAAGADDDLSPRPPLDTLLALLRIREQAVDRGCSGTGESSSTTAADRKVDEVLDPAPSSSSSSSDGNTSGADVDPSVPEFVATRDTCGSGRWEVWNKTIPVSEVSDHYCINPVNEAAIEAYCKFRPVRGDGNCFYRSFIFSYLEQVLYMKDSFDQRLILAAVERVANQCAHLGWPSNFSTGHKAFLKLIQKVMRWKTQRKVEASNNSYCGQKLLKFFNSNKKMQPIFVFLRLVAAIWICSHKEDYEPLITELGEGYDLQNWCSCHVIQCSQWADHIQMTALSTALEISLRVVNLNKGPAQDVHTFQGAPLVDLLFTGNHYDIIYPRQLLDKSVRLPDSGSTLHSQSHGEVEIGSQPIAANDLLCQPLPCTSDTVTPLIRSVWRQNCEEELDTLLSVVRQGRVTIAIDMEFASTAGTQSKPQTTAHWYSNIHALVNGGDILQVGLAVAFDSSSSTQASHVCEINLKFDENSRSYNKDTLEFLKEAKYNLEAHNSNGVLPARLARWILDDFDRLYDSDITWIVFQGDGDVGFLLKLIGNLMPQTRLEYLQRHNCSLPHLYDVRVLARILFGGHAKGLSWVAEAIKVKRIGREHSSGSDALLTLDCFLELRRRLGFDKIQEYRGIMDGIFAVDRIVSEALPMGHQSIQVIDVWEHNFEEEVKVMVQAMQNNFSIVGVDGRFFPVLCPRPFHKLQQLCLDQMFEVLKGVCSYEISLALVSYTGQIPQGRWWRIHVSEYYAFCFTPGAPIHVHFTRFADMLISCNLLNNPKITWGAFEGAEVFASLYHMVQRDTEADFPLNVLQYRRCRSLMFPSLRDVKLLVSLENATSLVDIARQLGLSITHQQSGWNALLIAQIVAQLREMLGHSDTILQAYAENNGHLRSKCCSHS